jgi:integrase
MAVYLRKKSISGGRKSYYLDIWHNDQRRYEFLRLYLVRARNPIDQKHNEQTKELAENIRAKRELDLTASDHDIIPKFKRNTDFLAYFDNFHKHYKNKDIRLVKGALTHFTAFIKDSGIKYLPIKSLDQQLCIDYKCYLETKVKGETVSNYYKKFKAAIQRAAKEKLIPADVSEGVKVPRETGLKKQILNPDEIQALAKAHCGNEQVKKAFLFCLMTGLRFCDVNELRWKNIDTGKIHFQQLKTAKTSKNAILSIDLNQTALNIIGDRGKPDEKVFHLPSHTACLKDLKTWRENAKIDKHITWHCARHSLAVNLLDKEVGNADVKTVAAILGHSGLAHVDKYLRVIDERKKEALNRLPNLKIV